MCAVRPVVSSEGDWDRIVVVPSCQETETPLIPLSPLWISSQNLTRTDEQTVRSQWWSPLPRLSPSLTLMPVLRLTVFNYRSWQSVEHTYTHCIAACVFVFVKGADLSFHLSHHCDSGMTGFCFYGVLQLYLATSTATAAAAGQSDCVFVLLFVVVTFSIFRRGVVKAAHIHTNTNI